MKFSRWKKKVMRKILEKTNFYEDVFFSDDFFKEYSRKVIFEWIYNLEKYKHIKIKRFKDLFSKYEEIVFPIEITHANIGGYFVELDIVDVSGKKYYFSQSNIWENIDEYYIGRRNTKSKPFLDNEIQYRILKNGAIEEVKKYIVKLKDDGTNESYKYEEYYNTNMQVIEISDSIGIIKIKYPIFEEVKKDLLAKFLSNNDKWYYYDIFPIFKQIVNKMKDCDIESIHIVAEIDNEVYSEIKLVNGIVYTYTITQVIREDEMHIIKKLFAKKLEEFLAEKQ